MEAIIGFLFICLIIFLTFTIIYLTIDITQNTIKQKQQYKKRLEENEFLNQNKNFPEIEFILNNKNITKESYE